MICALVGLRILLRDKPWRTTLVVWMGVTISWVGYWSISLGQLGLVLLCITAIYAWALIKKRDIVAGTMLALSTIKPQHFPFLVLPAFAGKRWKVLLFSALVELGLLVVSAARYGWENVVSYPKMLLDSETHYWPEFDMVKRILSLRGVLSQYVVKSVATAYGVGACAILLIVLFVISYRGIKKNGDLRWPIALCLVGSCALGPHTYLYDCALMAVSAALTVPSFNLFTLAKIKPVSFRLWCLMIFWYPLFSDVIGCLSLTVPYDGACRYFSLFLVANVAILSAGLIHYVQLLRSNDSIQVSDLETVGDNLTT